MARASREVWIERIERWRDSGLGAKEFAEQVGVEVDRLRHWKWRLAKEDAAAEPCSPRHLALAPSPSHKAATPPMMGVTTRAARRPCRVFASSHSAFPATSSRTPALIEKRRATRKGDYRATYESGHVARGDNCPRAWTSMNKENELPPPTPVDEETRQHVASLWNRIHAHLAVNDSYELSHLAPPATEAQICALEEAIGYRLPADYRASLAIHDGQQEDFVSVIDSLSLNSLRETLEEWRVMEELLRAGTFEDYAPSELPEEGLLAGWWNRGWLPIVSDNGNSINIDLDPADDGVVGQVFFFDHEQGAGPVLAHSFAEWLEQVAEELETGHTNDD